MKDLILRLTRLSGVPGAIALALVGSICIGPVMADDSTYVPTMKDMMSIQGALHRYHEGLDKHDNKLMASAFSDDGVIVMMVEGRELGTLNRAQITLTGAGGRPPPGGAPGSVPAPPPGAPPLPPAEPGDLWHFTDINSYFKFESPTRVTHYAYWMDVHVHQDSHSSTLGVPGHYEDVLIKRNGEWLFLSRKICVGTK